MMRRTLLAVLAFQMLVAYHAQATTRSAEWEKLRVEKSQTLQPNRMSFSERMLLQLEKGGLGLSYHGFYPSIASIRTGAGNGVQLRYWKQHFLTESVDFQVIGAVTSRNYQLYNVQFGEILKKGLDPIVGGGGSGGFHEFHGLRKRSQNDRFAYLDLKYARFTQEDFYGLGGDSSKDSRATYGVEASSGSAIGGFRLLRYGLVAAGISYIKTDLFPGTDRSFPTVNEIYTDDTAPGLTQQPDFLSINATFVIDYRDRPGNPHKGGMFGFEFARYNDRGGNEFEFNRYQFDARQYIPLGSDQRVLALRLLASSEDPDGDAVVPFYLQETLGGAEILRGFNDFRFRDRNLFYMSGEYRWEAAPALEFALFYDTGKVFADRSDFDFQELQKSWGFGVRFKLAHSQFLRIDTARSDEGTRVYIRFGIAPF